MGEDFNRFGLFSSSVEGHGSTACPTQRKVHPTAQGTPALALFLFFFFLEEENDRCLFSA